MSTTSIRLITGLSLVGLLALAQNAPPLIGRGWLPEFNHAAQQLNALAEATPAEKFAWRPAPGVRSVSEVYMHLAIANFFLAAQAGVKLPEEVAGKIKMETEKAVTEKADVVRWLKDSQELVRANYPKVELQKKVKFFGADTTADGVMLRLLVHNHEHMGQSIAYARMMGVVPPWSTGASAER